MKKIVFAFILFMSVIQTEAQLLTVRGVAVESGDTLRNKMVLVKNRNITTKTDNHGYFVVSGVTEDDVVMVFLDRNCINNVSYSVKNIKEIIAYTQYASTIPSKLETKKSTKEVCVMSDSLPVITKGLNDGVFDSRNLLSVDINKKSAVLETFSTSSSAMTNVYYSSFLKLSQIGELPDLQSTYAQGRGGNWQGASQNEIFSWGSAVKSLEYLSGNYAYDKNGSLTTSGSGNGTAAKTYDPYDFFRTSLSYGNAVDVVTKTRNNAVLNFSLGQQNYNSPIPNAYDNNYNASVILKNLKYKKFTADAAILFKENYSQLPQSGANIATLLHSIYTTPSTFDNANGLSNYSASNETASWLLSDGSQRSYAPYSVFNPYYLVQHLLDTEQSDNILTYAKIKYAPNRKFSTTANFSYEKEWNQRNGGIEMTGLLDRFSARSENMDNCAVKIEAEYNLKKSSYYPAWNFKFDYQSNYQHYDINRTDKFYWENKLDTLFSAYNILNRLTNELTYFAGWSYDKRGLYANFIGRQYFSNTIAAKYNGSFYPGIAAAVRLTDLFRLNYHYRRIFSNIKIFGSIGQSEGESPLVFRNNSVLTTVLPSLDFRSFYDSQELVWHKNLKPETYLKREVGVDLGFIKDRIAISAVYFNNSTDNMVAPDVYTNGVDNQFLLANLGSIKNAGLTVQSSFILISKRYYKLTCQLNFDKARSTVTSLNQVNLANGYSRPDDFVRLAGFTNVATVFKDGETLGAIYGTTYLRNADGKIVIDADGYPMVDNTLRKIGDPTPDYKMTLTPSFQCYDFVFSFSVEYSHGGDRWNGTKAWLDYVGMSEESAKLRNTKAYVFDGVDQSGNVNTKAVDFYDTSQPVYSNRWTRYGVSGVGEAYIEDASYLRLSYVNLQYNFKKRFLKKTRVIQDMSLVLSAQNLLLLTHYSGSDPSSTLFGNITGYGLDLFNTPSARSYSLSLNVKL